MTPLNKPIKRLGKIPVHTIGNKLLVVKLEPPDRIAIRPEKSRGRWFEATFAEVYLMLAMVEARRQEKYTNRRLKELKHDGVPARAARKQARLEVRHGWHINGGG